MTRWKEAAHETWIASYDAAREVAVDAQREFARMEFDSAKGKVIRLEAEVATLEGASFDKLSGSRDAKVVQSELEDARNDQKRLGTGQLCGTFFLKESP